MPGPIDYSKITIMPDFDTVDWWMGTKEHKYLVRQCNECQHKWFPMDIFKGRGWGSLLDIIVWTAATGLAVLLLRNW